MHPVQCAQSAWIRGGIMVWICLLAAGSPQYLIHHRLVGWHGLDWTVLPTYSTFIVLCDECLSWLFPVWWWVLSMVLKGLWCNTNIAASYTANLWINGETNTFLKILILCITWHNWCEFSILLPLLCRLSDLNFGLKGLMWVASSLLCQPLWDRSQMDLRQLSHTQTPARWTEDDMSLEANLFSRVWITGKQVWWPGFTGCSL